MSKAGLAPKSKERYEQCVANLKEEFGKALVCDVDANDSAEYRGKRLSATAEKRYSHIRSQAKQAAIQALELGAIEPNFTDDRAQNRAQCRKYSWNEKC